MIDDFDFDDPSAVRRPRTVITGRRQLTADERSVVLADLSSQIQTVFGVLGEVNSRWPAQPPSGSILRWERTFRSSGATDNPVYTYVALRVNDQWYVTGRRNEIINWEQLQKLIDDSPCFLVTAYAEIPRPAKDPREELDPALWHQAFFGDNKEKSSDELKAELKGKDKKS